MLNREEHLSGILRLVDPTEKDRLKRAIETEKGRKKWLARLAHKVEMHPEFSQEMQRGERDGQSLLTALRQLGAPETCYVIASDHAMDDTFQPLQDILLERYLEFGHGTIISCLPGTLALFRSAYPHRSVITSRR